MLNISEHYSVVHCGVHWKSKSYSEFLCGKNGSINLELVKSLLSLRVKKRERESERKRDGKRVKEEGRKEGGERGLRIHNSKATAEIKRYTDSGSSIR